MPTPTNEELENNEKTEYIQRFMQSAEAKRDYPDVKNRVAVAYGMWKEHKKNNK